MVCLSAGLARNRISLSCRAMGTKLQKSPAAPEALNLVKKVSRWVNVLNAICATSLARRRVFASNRLLPRLYIRVPCTVPRAVPCTEMPVNTTRSPNFHKHPQQSQHVQGHCPPTCFRSALENDIRHYNANLLVGLMIADIYIYIYYIQ